MVDSVGPLGALGPGSAIVDRVLRGRLASPLAPADRPARPRAAGGCARGVVIADTDEIALDLLRTPEAGGRVVRGGLIRGVGYGIGTALGLATAVLLLRHLGVDDFGRFATVTAVLGIVAGVTDAGLTAVGSREISVARTAAERASLLNNLLLLRVIGASLGVVAAILFTGRRRLRRHDDRGHGPRRRRRRAHQRAVDAHGADLGRPSDRVADGVGGAPQPPDAGRSCRARPRRSRAASVLRRPGRRRSRPDPGHGAARASRACDSRAAFAARWSCWLLRETLPLAVAFAMSVIYFRVLVVLVSLLSNETETGLFGTSFRIFEMLLAPAGAHPLGRAAAALGRRRRGRGSTPSRASEHDRGVTPDRGAARRRDRDPGRAGNSPHRWRRVRRARARSCGSRRSR